MALNKSETSLNMDLESKQKIVLLKVKNRSRKSWQHTNLTNIVTFFCFVLWNKVFLTVAETSSVRHILSTLPINMKNKDV